MIIFNCPICGGPCDITWSGLDLVTNSGDETLATKNYISKAPDMLALLREMAESLKYYYDPNIRWDIYNRKLGDALEKYNKLFSE